MTPANLLFLFSDEHNPACAGFRGHPFVKTPNLDRLAGWGTVFTAAYTNCPICVPARASLATGRHVHETGYWDNAIAYDGRVPSWGHALQDAGIPVTAIGKLHYRDESDPTGFDRQILPMHVEEGGLGQLWGLQRDPPPVFDDAGRKMLTPIGPGYSAYNAYDDRVTAEACDWLSAAAAQPRDEPWVLFVGLVAPHFPLTVPEDYLAMYPPGDLPVPPLHPSTGYVRHPWVEAFHRSCPVDDYLDADQRRLAAACYYGLCTFLDDRIGRILQAIEAAGLADTTRIIYASDHGDSIGNRGLWGKSVLYEESCGIPLIVAGPGVPAGRTCGTPVSLIDSYPTILDGVGLTADDDTLPGRSLFGIAAADDDRDRIVLSEYHAVASPSAGFMVRRDNLKYLHYVGYPPELFDLAADPGEMRNLAAAPEHTQTVREFDALLRGFLDPDATDRRAKADQKALIEKHGGFEAIRNIGAKDAVPPPDLSQTD